MAAVWLSWQTTRRFTAQSAACWWLGWSCAAAVLPVGMMLRVAMIPCRLLHLLRLCLCRLPQPDARSPRLPLNGRTNRPPRHLGTTPRQIVLPYRSRRNQRRRSTRSKLAPRHRPFRAARVERMQIATCCHPDPVSVTRAETCCARPGGKKPCAGSCPTGPGAGVSNSPAKSVNGVSSAGRPSASRESAPRDSVRGSGQEALSTTMPAGRSRFGSTNMVEAPSRRLPIAASLQAAVASLRCSHLRSSHRTSGLLSA